MYLHSISHEFATSQNPQLTSHIMYMQGEIEARDHQNKDRRAFAWLKDWWEAKLMASILLIALYDVCVHMTPS